MVPLSSHFSSGSLPNRRYSRVPPICSCKPVRELVPAINLGQTDAVGRNEEGLQGTGSLLTVFVATYSDYVVAVR